MLQRLFFLLLTYPFWSGSTNFVIAQNLFNQTLNLDRMDGLGNTLAHGELRANEKAAKYKFNINFVEEGTAVPQNYEADAANDFLEDGKSYTISTIINDTKYLLTYDGYLTSENNDAAVFTFRKCQVEGTFMPIGWQCLESYFSNSYRTKGENGTFIADNYGHITVNGSARKNWEAQVYYLRNGKYAVRSTNATDTSWLCDWFWTIDWNDEGVPVTWYTQVDDGVHDIFIWDIEERENQNANKYAEIDAAVASIESGGKYMIYTYSNGTSLGQTKYYLQANGYLSDNEDDAGIFTFNQCSEGAMAPGKSFFINSGYGLFTNIDSETGIVDETNNKQINTNGSDKREDWDSQVLFLNNDGDYAIRSTNAISSNWGANLFWTVIKDNDEDGIPNATYSTTSDYIWHIEAHQTANYDSVIFNSSCPLITNVKQLSSPYTDPKEGSLAALLDNEFNTIWHSNWHDGEVIPGTHYLQVEMPNNISSEYPLIVFQFTRRDTNNDHTVKWSVRGTNQENASKEACEELLVALTPLKSIPETVVSQAFNHKGYKYLRFYSEVQTGRTHNSHGYFHLSEFQLYPVANEFKFNGHPVSEGTYYLYNVGSEKWFCAGNEWETHASISEIGGLDVSLLKSDEQSYYIYTGIRYQDKDESRAYLANVWCDQEKERWKFTQVRSSPEIYLISNKDGNLSCDIGSTNLILSQTTGISAQWILVTKEERIAALSKATPETPMDATFLLSGANFGSCDYRNMFWDVSASDFSGFWYRGHTVAESRNSSFTVQQTISSAPNGTYGLTAQGCFLDNNLSGNLPFFFINNTRRAFPAWNNRSSFNMEEVVTTFQAGFYTIGTIGCYVSSSTINIGATLNNRSDLWSAWDNYKLTYYGPSNIASDITKDDVSLPPEIPSIDEMRAALSKANIDNPIDITSMVIRNPNYDFEQWGWQMDISASHVQFLNSTYSYGDSSVSGFLEAWNNNQALNDGNISQIISNLPMGKYQLEVDAIAKEQKDNSPVSGVSIFASAISSMEGGAYKSISTEKNSPQHVTLVFDKLDDAPLYIGIRTQNTNANWIVVDNWKLVCLESEKSSVTLIAKSYTRKYGEINPAFTYTSEGAELIGEPVISCEANEVSPVGNYPIIITKGNVQNSECTLVNGTLTITKASLTITATSYTIQEGDPLPEFMVTYEGFKNGETASTLTRQPTIRCVATTPVVAGTYEIIVSDAEAQNYAMTYVAGTLTVIPQPVILTANNYTIEYGEPLPEFGFNSKGGTLQGTPAITCPATSSSPVGTYPIVINKGSVINSEVEYINGTLTITQAPLTITVNDAQQEYGEQRPTYIFSYEGFKNGETEADLILLPVANAEGRDAGFYPITVDGAMAQNYAITYESGTLTILPAPLIIKAQDCGRIYGEETPSFAVTYDGFKYDDTEAVLLTQPVFDCNGKDVGNYPILVSGAEAENYEISYQEGTLTISPAPLCIKALDCERIYGEETPSFAVTYDGFKYDDTEAVLLTQPVFNCDGKNVGNYPIIVSGAEAHNYEITHVDGILIINPADLTVMAKDATRYVGEENPEFELQYDGWKYNDDESVLTEMPVAVTAADEGSKPGSYEIIVTGGEADNYVITHVNGTLTVLPLPTSEFLADGMRFLVTDAVEHIVTLIKQNNGIQHMVIPSTVTAAVGGSEFTWTVTSLADSVFVGCEQLVTVEIPATITAVGKDVFSGCPHLAAITWKAPVKMTRTMVGDLENPNLLLYMADKTNALENVTNVIDLNNMMAERIVLKDDEGTNDFYCPLAFTANEISYTHEYGQETKSGSSQGWDALTLPFDVVRVEHSQKGEIHPFSTLTQQQIIDGEKPFWLYAFTSNGFVEADAVHANIPYIISMPNEKELWDDYILKGQVTFRATNAKVCATSEASSIQGNNKAFTPNYRKETSDDYFLLNVRDKYNSHAEGSVFTKGRRGAHPFEAYFTTTADVKEFGVFDEVASGISDNSQFIHQSQLSGVVYDMQGRKIVNGKLSKGKLPKGLYIVNGKKVSVK